MNDELTIEQQQALFAYIQLLDDLPIWGGKCFCGERHSMSRCKEYVSHGTKRVKEGRGRPKKPASPINESAGSGRLLAP